MGSNCSNRRPWVLVLVVLVVCSVYMMCVCTWSSIFLCSWTILFSIPVLSFFKCSAERASIFSCFTCRLARMHLYAHWMMMAALRARLNFFLCSQLRTHFWMIMALWCRRNCREESEVYQTHCEKRHSETFHLKLETLCLQFTREQTGQETECLLTDVN